MTQLRLRHFQFLFETAGAHHIFPDIIACRHSRGSGNNAPNPANCTIPCQSTRKRIFPFLACQFCDSDLIFATDLKLVKVKRFGRILAVVIRRNKLKKSRSPVSPCTLFFYFHTGCDRVLGRGAAVKIHRQVARVALHLLCVRGKSAASDRRNVITALPNLRDNRLVKALFKNRPKLRRPLGVGLKLLIRLRAEILVHFYGGVESSGFYIMDQ